MKMPSHSINGFNTYGTVHGKFTAYIYICYNERALKAAQKQNEMYDLQSGKKLSKCRMRYAVQSRVH